MSNCYILLTDGRRFCVFQYPSLISADWHLDIQTAISAWHPTNRSHFGRTTYSNATLSDILADQPTFRRVVSISSDINSLIESSPEWQI